MSVILRVAAIAALFAGALAFNSTAEAKCSGISGTADGTDKSIAVQRSQQAVAEAVEEWKRKMGVRNVSMRPMYAKPNPYWRTAVSADLYVKPDVRTARFHTTCWRGVVSPVVCTTGTRVCY
jgi:hypothetical protein